MRLEMAPCWPSAMLQPGHTVLVGGGGLEGGCVRQVQCKLQFTQWSPRAPTLLPLRDYSSAQ